MKTNPDRRSDEGGTDKYAINLPLPPPPPPTAYQYHMSHPKHLTSVEIDIIEDNEREKSMINMAGLKSSHKIDQVVQYYLCFKCSISSKKKPHNK